MELKYEVLTLLRENPGEFLSGQEIANRLSFSRTAIWKAINRLKEEGYSIESIGSKGYRLWQDEDALSCEQIKRELKEEYQGIPIEVYRQLDSTNTCAKLKAIEGALHGSVILAEEQTKGRGRFGRSFYSPKGTGLYMSLILRPTIELKQSVHVTMYIAVLICRVLERFTNQRLQIKWVNDIYLGDKKIGGILTEAVTDVESKQVQYMILGIGLNIKTEDFPGELDKIATSLNPVGVTRNQLCAALLNEILPVSEYFTIDEEILCEYKRRSNVLGQRVVFFKKQQRFEGMAEDIDETGGLVVHLTTGEVETLHSGEISIQRQTTVDE